MGWLSLGPASLARRARRGAAPAVSATAAPVLGALADGDEVQSGLSAGALDAASYASTEGAIASVAATVTIKGAAGALTDTVAAGDTVSVVITVTDDAGNSRDFFAGAQIVPGVAPSLTASDSLAGRSLTISVGSVTGNPAPAVTLTALTLDGVSVLGDETGANPWTYTPPDNGSPRTVAWTVTASNFEGTATASGSETMQVASAIANPFVDYNIDGTLDGPSDIKGLRLSTDGGTTWGTMSDLGITATYPENKKFKLSGGQWASVTHIHFEQEDGEFYVEGDGVENIPLFWPDQTFPRPDNAEMPGISLTPTEANSPLEVT